MATGVASGLFYPAIMKVSELFGRRASHHNVAGREIPPPPKKIEATRFRRASQTIIVQLCPVLLKPINDLAALGDPIVVGSPCEPGHISLAPSVDT